MFERFLARQARAEALEHYLDDLPQTDHAMPPRRFAKHAKTLRRRAVHLLTLGPPQSMGRRPERRRWTIGQYRAHAQILDRAATRCGIYAETLRRFGRYDSMAVELFDLRRRLFEAAARMRGRTLIAGKPPRAAALHAQDLAAQARADISG